MSRPVRSNRLVNASALVTGRLPVRLACKSKFNSLTAYRRVLIRYVGFYLGTGAGIVTSATKLAYQKIKRRKSPSKIDKDLLNSNRLSNSGMINQTTFTYDKRNFPVICYVNLLRNNQHLIATMYS